MTSGLLVSAGTGVGTFFSGVDVSGTAGTTSFGSGSSFDSGGVPSRIGCGGPLPAGTGSFEMLLRFGVDSCTVGFDGAEAGVTGRAVVVSPLDVDSVCETGGATVATDEAGAFSACCGGTGRSFFFLGVVVENAGGNLNFLPLSFFRRSKVADGGGKGSFFVLDDRGDMEEIGFPSVGEGSGVAGGVARGVELAEGPLGVGIPAINDPAPTGGPVEIVNDRTDGGPAFAA